MVAVHAVVARVNPRRRRHLEHPARYWCVQRQRAGQRFQSRGVEQQAAMVNDVQSWIDNPGSNNGWMVIGDEVNPTTARRFDSSEGGSPPQLVVDFTPTGDTEACCDPVTGSCSLTIVGSGTCSGDPQGTGTTCEPNLCPQPIGACCNADSTCSDESQRCV